MPPILGDECEGADMPTKQELFKIANREQSWAGPRPAAFISMSYAYRPCFWRDGNQGRWVNRPTRRPSYAHRSSALSIAFAPT